MNEIDILNIEIGGQKIKDMSAISFLQWLSGKINGIKTYTATSQELIQRVANPPFGSKLQDTEKIEIVRKLISLDVKIP